LSPSQYRGAIKNSFAFPFVERNSGRPASVKIGIRTLNPIGGAGMAFAVVALSLRTAHSGLNGPAL
jgi:hypothetical protein